MVGVGIVLLVVGMLVDRLESVDLVGSVVLLVGLLLEFGPRGAARRRFR